jgi:hypothetical protein
LTFDPPLMWIGLGIGAISVILLGAGLVIRARTRREAQTA